MKADFFSEITNTKPYLKAAFEGFAGTGKTFTASQIAIGLHKRIGSTKPVILFDTERAVKFLKPLFAQAGIKVLVKESRSLTDLKETMRLMRDEAVSDILIIDSISHIWEKFLSEYLIKVSKNPEYPRTRLEFQDWGIVKPTWKREFSDPFVNDPYHCIICGRAGYEYTDEKNSETGKREIFKSGIKMKVEGETAYEPDILVLMERFEEILTDNKKVWREATIIKDRSNLIDGKTFKNPTYADFSPAVEAMLENPEYSVSADKDDGALFKTEESKQEYRRACIIETENITAALVQEYPGQTAVEKKAKVDALKDAFGTASWTEIENLGLEKLKAGRIFLENKIKAKKQETA
jgi:hypothetical protein